MAIKKPPAIRPGTPPASTRARDRWKTPSKREREINLVAETAARTAVHAMKDKPGERDYETPEDGGSTLFRMRRHLRPIYIAAGIWFGAWSALSLTKVPGVPAWNTNGWFFATMIAVGATAVFLVCRLVSKTWRIRALIATVAATGWFTWVVARGDAGPAWNPVDQIASSALVLGTLALSARWWQSIRPGYPTEAPTKPKPKLKDLDAGPPRPDRDDVAGNWRQNLGAQGKKFAGSRIHSRDASEDGASEAWTVDGVPGLHTLSLMNTSVDAIASGLRREIHEVIVEKHPSKDASQMLLTVVKHSPIEETVVFEGPAFFQEGKNGWIEPATYADGKGRVKVPIRGANSAYHATIIGGQGSGKTALMNVATISLHASGLAMSWYLDGQGGTSSPQLLRHADWAPVGEDRVLTVLRVAEAEARRRERHMRANRLHGITPAIDPATGQVEFPHLNLIVDECHEVFNRARYGDQGIRRWEDLARISRKLCISIIPATQHPSIESFGGSDTLRSMLMQYTTLVLRTQSAVAKNILRISMDPKDLPMLPGFGFIESNYPGVRSAPFRADYVDGDEPEHGGETDADAWFIKYPSLSLTDKAVAELGKAGEPYARRREIAEEEFQKLINGGFDDEDDEEMNGRLTYTGGGSGVNPPPIPDNLVMRPRPVSVPDGLTESQATVYRAVANGTSKAADLIQKTGLSKSQTHLLLKQLVEQGHLAKSGQEYTATAKHLGAVE